MKTISNKLSQFIFWVALILIAVLLIVGFTGETTSKFPLFLALGVLAGLVVFMVLQIFNRAKQGEAVKIVLRLLLMMAVFFIVLFCFDLAFDKDVLQKVGRTCFSAVFKSFVLSLMAIWGNVLKSS